MRNVFKDKRLTKTSSKTRSDDEIKLLKKISKKLRADLVKSGFNVDQLAVESETSRGSVRRVLDGNDNITILTLDRLSKALGYEGALDFLNTIKN